MAFSSCVLRMSRLSLACTLALLSSQVHSDESSSVERLTVYGQRQTDTFGSKSGIAFIELPQSVQLVDVSAERGQGMTSVGDLLRQIPSANPGYSRVGPYQSFSLKIRGFMADQMRNGMRQRYFEDIDASALASIERLEVLKGPSGVLYGQSAVGGVINLVSKAPEANQSGSVTARLGSYAQKVVTVEQNVALGDDAALRVTAEVERSNTFVTRQPLDRNNAALHLVHQVADMATGHLVAEYVNRDTTRNPGQPVSLVLPDQHVRALEIGTQLGEPSFSTLQAFAPLYQYWLDVKLSEQWTLTPRLQYQEFNTVFGQVNVRAPVAGKPTSFARTGRVGREDDDYRIAQLDLNGSADLLGVTHRVLLGYEGSWERGRFTQSNIRAGSLAAIDVLNPIYQYDSQSPLLDFAFDNFYNLDSDAWYLQDQLQLSSAWQVIAAVRYTDSKAGNGRWGSRQADYVPTSSTIWQLGMTYQLSDAWTLFAGHNTGFDVESSAAARRKDGQPLQPEESAQQEAGVRLHQDGVSASIAVFQIHRLNALTADPLDADFSVNDGEQRVNGVELEGQWRINAQWELQAGYAYMDGEVTQSHDGDVGARLGDLARHQANASVNWLFSEDWSTYVRVNYSSGRPLTTGASWQLDGYRLVSTGLRYQQRQWSAQLALTNAFDEGYYTASGNNFVVYPGEPRQASVQLQWQW